MAPNSPPHARAGCARAGLLLRSLVALLSLFAHPALQAQTLGQALTGGKAQTATPTPVTDPLNRQAPRPAIYSFLQACHANNFQLASQYLDLHRIRADQRAAQGPELAHELAGLLDKNPAFEVGRLSNAETGNLTDGLPPNQDRLATFQLDRKTVDLFLQRVSQQGSDIWLVSADSVATIPELHGLADESDFEKKLPVALVRTRLIGTPLWICLTLVLVALLLSLISRFLSSLCIAGLEVLGRRYAWSLQTFRLETLLHPIRLLVSIVLFRAAMTFIPPSALLRDYLLKWMAVLFIFGAAALLMRIVDVISDQLISRSAFRDRAFSSSVVPLLVRFVKMCVFCIAALAVLASWGYNINAILAGVGVGGLAVALAAQKTIENLFGGISVITDRPVLVGDFCQFGGQLGTVEDIGLRSTRIRTLNRTLVSVPNSQFSTMTLENYSRRDRMWFHPTLSLRRDTKPEQIRAMMDGITKLLKDNPRVDASGVPLRFTKISPESFELEIFAYVETPDFNEYLKVQTELLLGILDLAASLNVGFAVPFQETVTAASHAGMRDSLAALQAQRNAPRPAAAGDNQK